MKTVSIVVLHRGWVIVGSDVGHDDGFLKLDNCAVIRRWGTTKGLGEIAEGGPTSSTILDKTPPMTMPLGAVINIIDCNGKAWAKHLEG